MGSLLCSGQMLEPFFVFKIAVLGDHRMGFRIIENIRKEDRNLIIVEDDFKCPTLESSSGNGSVGSTFSIPPLSKIHFTPKVGGSIDRVVVFI